MSVSVLCLTDVCRLQLVRLRLISGHLLNEITARLNVCYSYGILFVNLVTFFRNGFKSRILVPILRAPGR